MPEEIYQSVGYVLAAVVLVIARHVHRGIEKKVDRIDDAVNSRPSDQPKLYDVAQTSDSKIDVVDAKLDAISTEMREGFTSTHRRVDQVDRRINGVDDRVAAIEQARVLREDS